MLTVRDFYPEFSQAYAQGDSRWHVAGLPVHLTPILPADTPEMLRIFADPRVITFIENASTTTLAEIREMATELHTRPGNTVRFAVRDETAAMLGVMNCAALSPALEALNPRMFDSILTEAVQFSGELAFYHAARSAQPSQLVMLPPGVRNLPAQENRLRWLATLQTGTLQRAWPDFDVAIARSLASLTTIQPDAVLCSTFALGYVVMVNMLCQLAAGRGIGAHQVKFLLFTDPGNLPSLRMLLPFGAQIEGFCWYPNPDGSRRARVILSQSPAAIETFLQFTRDQIGSPLA